ncbi:MAG: YbhB/YbcL family Raf kinase inhibitor-like protein [Candidatus Omnitrophota bacterium]
MRFRKYFMVVIFLSILFCAGLFFPGSALGLELTSPAFKDGEVIPEEYTCKGEDISPALNWNDAPEGTKSFVLIMDDPDAPMGAWIHWVIYNIPGDAVGLEKNVQPEFLLGRGIMHGINSFRRPGYGGPCPPPGPAHRYFFKLYALDTTLGLRPGASKGDVMRAIQGHILESAQIIGSFKR